MGGHWTSQERLGGWFSVMSKVPCLAVESHDQDCGGKNEDERGVQSP